MADEAESRAPERFVLTLRALRDRRPAAVRLRLLLKDLLRAGNFRCEKVEALDAAQPTGGKDGAGCG
jgi:hypothetical protein